MFRLPPPDDTIDQGDLIDGCPLLRITDFAPDGLRPLNIDYVPARVIVLTQTCDLANTKVQFVVVALVREAQSLVTEGLLKATDVKGPIRGGRVWGLYFLPRSDEFGLPESIIDLRQLHTVRLDLLTTLCRSGRRLARLQPLYREHLAKHFGDTYSRIGLPAPYPTE